jgi:acetyl/propionyl-CoA carboxylase alpha subunit
VRVDTGVYEGGEVPVHYDPLMAKLIVWGHTREEAVRRMGRALDEFGVAGVQTTIPFHRAIMRDPDFLAGRLSTTLVERAVAGGRGLPAPSPDRARAAAVAVALRARERAPGPLPAAPGPSRWAMAGRPGPGAPRR